jgi:hypothetical protein
LIREQFSTDIQPFEKEKIGCVEKAKKRKTHLLTAFHTTCPPMIGTTWVKLKPESMISMHSGFANPGRSKRVPWGIVDAAGSSKHMTRKEGMFQLTIATVVGLKLVLFKHKLIVYVLDVGQIEVGFGDE